MEMLMMKELTMNEMNAVSGGIVAAGGVKNKPRVRHGYIRHRITANDTVWGLSRHYHCSIDSILRANPTIKDARLIRTNYWLYIPRH